MGDDQFNFLQFDKHSVFYVRGEEINLFILLMTFLKNGFLNLKENYRINYLKFVKAKYIITYRCNNESFYKIKKNIKNVSTILIQWEKLLKIILDISVNFRKKKKLSCR